MLSVVGHHIKNHFSNRGRKVHSSTETLYVTVEGLREDPAADYQVNRLS